MSAILHFAVRVAFWLLLIAVTVSIAIAYLDNGTIGGAIVMGLWAALLAYTFLPDAWASRPRREPPEN